MLRGCSDECAFRCRLFARSLGWLIAQWVPLRPARSFRRQKARYPTSHEATLKAPKRSAAGVGPAVLKGLPRHHLRPGARRAPEERLVVRRWCDGGRDAAKLRTSSSGGGGKCQPVLSRRMRVFASFGAGREGRAGPPFGVMGAWLGGRLSASVRGDRAVRLNRVTLHRLARDAAPRQLRRWPASRLAGLPCLVVRAREQVAGWSQLLLMLKMMSEGVPCGGAARCAARPGWGLTRWNGRP